MWDADLLALTFLIPFESPRRDFGSFGHKLEILDVQRDQFGAPKRSRESDEQEGRLGRLFKRVGILPSAIPNEPSKATTVEEAGKSPATVS